MTTIFQCTLAALAIAALGGCNREQAPPADRDADQQPPGGLVEPSPLSDPRKVTEQGQLDNRPEQSVARMTARKLWPELADYRAWTAHTNVPVRGEHPQGEFIQLFYNEPAKAAIGGAGEWPDAVIFVKDNYAPNQAGDGPGALTAITMMKKDAGVWFWAQYKPDGSLFETPEGTVVAGTADLGCIACHMSAAHRDHVITELGAKAGASARRKPL